MVDPYPDIKLNSKFNKKEYMGVNICNKTRKITCQYSVCYHSLDIDDTRFNPCLGRQNLNPWDKV